MALAGTLFLPPHGYDGLARSASGVLPPEAVPEGMLRDIVRGETAHHLLQAASRGSIRRSVGGNCAPGTLWVVASKRSGIEAVLPTVFPGCRIRRSSQVRKPLKGRVGEAMEIVCVHFETSEEPLMRAELRRRLGIRSAGTFRNQVWGPPTFLDAPEAQGFAIDAVNASTRASLHDLPGPAPSFTARIRSSA